jgi:hypothetical protein
MNRFVVPALLAIACGCGTEEAEVESTSSPLVLGGPYFQTMVTPDDLRAVSGPDANDWACYLTRVAGRVDGNFTTAEISAANPNWRLFSDAPGTTATCVDLSWFRAPGPERWARATRDGQLADDPDPAGGAINDGYAIVNAGFGCQAVKAPLWFGDAGSYISIFHSINPNSGTSLSIEEGTATTPSYAVASQCSLFSPAGTQGVASGSIFIGTPGAGIPAAYVGGTYSVTSRSTNWTMVTMAPSNQAVCWFTKLTGAMPGVIKIEETSDGHWRLLGKSAPGGLGVDTTFTVQARCYARNQPS